jgi:hypothetical protein
MPRPACVWGMMAAKGIAKRKGATARWSSRPDVSTLLGRFQVYQLATRIWREHLLRIIRPVAVPVSMPMPSNRRRGQLSSRQIAGSQSSFLVVSDASPRRRDQRGRTSALCATQTSSYR